MVMDGSFGFGPFVTRTRKKSSFWTLCYSEGRFDLDLLTKNEEEVVFYFIFRWLCTVYACFGIWGWGVCSVWSDGAGAGAELSYVRISSFPHFLFFLLLGS